MPVDPVGFWGVPTASIDWCEQNYALLPWVCEAFNTVSSLAMVLAGALGLSRQTFAREVRVAFALLVLVGLGSIAFHATLRFELRMLDGDHLFTGESSERLVDAVAGALAQR